MADPVAGWRQVRDESDCATLERCRKPGVCTLKKVAQGGIGLYLVDGLELCPVEQLLMAPAAVAKGDMWGDEHTVPDAPGSKRKHGSALDPEAFVALGPKSYSKLQSCWEAENARAQGR